MNSMRNRGKALIFRMRLYDETIYSIQGRSTSPENNNIGKLLRSREDVKFERIRRISGYLVGATERWNDEK